MNAALLLAAHYIHTIEDPIPCIVNHEVLQEPSEGVRHFKPGMGTFFHQLQDAQGTYGD